MYYYIFNPAAGGAQTRLIQSRVQQRLTALGIIGEWVKTTGPGEATRLTEAAVKNDQTTIVAVGGDDTVNEVINGLGETSSAAVGVIPLGHANHLAIQLGILNWQQACEVLAARRITAYNLIAAGQKYFLSTLKIGFETDLDKTIDRSPTGWRARSSQLQAGWGQARAFTTLRSRLVVDNTLNLECDLFSLTVANQKFIDPQAKNKLVISLTDRPDRRQLGNYLWQLVRHNDSPLEETATTRLLADRIVIETTPSSGIMVDGKVAGRTPIDIRLTDRKIRFITEKVPTGFTTLNR